MQVSPLNLTSFKGSGIVSDDARKTPYNHEEFTAYGEDEFDGDEFKHDIESDEFVGASEEPEDTKINHEDTARIIGAFNKEVEKINSNVHPATIIASVAAAAAVAKTASKFVPVARRATAKVGEAVATSAVKVYGKVKNAIKKDSFDTEKIVGNIRDYSKKHFRVINEIAKDGKNVTNIVNGQVIDTDNNKMIGFVEKQVDDIFGKNKAENVKQIMQKNKIVNGAGLFDAAVAMGIGLGTVNGTSDITENALDKADLAEIMDKTATLLGE